MKNIEIIIEKVNALAAAPTVCAELKEKAQEFISAAGTEKESEAGEKLVKEIEECVSPVDGLIAFFASDKAKEIFGKEKAEEIYNHGVEITANGALYCDCPACAAALAVLEYKDDILGK